MKTVGLIAFALVCGAVAGHLLFDLETAPNADAAPAERTSPQAAPVPASHAESPATMLDSLAGIIDAEVAERRRLEQKVDALSADLDALRATLLGEPPADSEPAIPEAVAAELSDDLQIGALMAAGIEELEAREIKRRMDALDMEMMDLQYEASQEGWIGTERFADAFRDLREQRARVRESIGDDSYDRYLYAMGQPNRVAVQQVLEGSPAQRAGLRSGDLLLSYGGERLFTLNELVQHSRSGANGETVTLEIVRDGRLTHLYIPRGPLGIRSGFQYVDPSDPPP